MLSNRAVADAWMRGEAADSEHMHSDGEHLRSYGLRIGNTVFGRKVVGNYRSRGGGEYYSSTTSTHVGEAERAGGEVIPVAVFIEGKAY